MLIVSVLIQYSLSQTIPEFSEIASESSLILYLNPLDDIKISIYNLSTYFSNWKPLKYLSLYIDVHNSDNTSKTYGPIKTKNHLCGINLMKNYDLRFYYDGISPKKIALMFSKNFDSASKPTMLSEYEFPIFSHFKTQKELNDFGEFIYPDTIKLSYVAIILICATLVLLIILSCTCKNRY